MPQPPFARTLARALPSLGIACLVLATGVAASYALWREADSYLARQTRSHFDTSASLALAGIQRRVDEYQTVLLGMQGLFIASASVDRRGFRRYYEDLHGQLRLPGIRALHFTRWVPDAEKSAFVAAVRHDRSLDQKGFPDFAIHPESNQSEHFVIEYIEPFAENRRAFGLDATSQPVNRESFLAARDTGKTSFTPPFQLIQAAPGEAGIVLRAPVYRYGAPLGSVDERRRAFTGLVGISLDAKDMFGDIFAEPFLDGLCLLVQDIQAGGSAANPAPLRLSIAQQCAGQGAPGKELAALSQTTIVAAGGRLWEVRLSAGENWRRRQQGNETPALILTAGVLVSLLLAALYLALARSRTRAEQLAARITSDLRRSEQRFRAMAEMSEDWFWEQDAEGRFVSITGTGTRGAGMMPLAPTAMEGKTRWELAPSALTPPQWEAHRRQLLAREAFVLEYPLANREGQQRWMKTFGAPRYDEAGVFLGYHGTAHDVTARKTAEAEMARKTSVLQATLENMSQGISVVDENLRMTGLNGKFCEILGFPEDMAREGAAFEAFVRYNVEHGEYGPCDVEAKVREMVERAKLMQAHRFKRTRPDGRIVEVVGNPIPGGGFVTTYTDVTEQERANQAVRVSQARLARAELASRSGNWELHLDSKVIIASAGAAKLYGLADEHSDYAFVKTMALAEYRPLLDAAMKKLIEDDQPYDVEFKIVKADSGEIRDIHSIAVYDKEERVVFGVIQDITERKRAEAILLQSEERFSKAFHSSPLAASIARAGDGRFLDANKNYERDFGWKAEQLIGRTSLEVGLWPDAESRRPWAEALLAKGRVVGWETVWHHRNGEDRWVSLSAETVDIDGEPCILAFVMDIGERKRAEESLQLAASVFSHAREGIMITDAAGDIVRVNDTFTQITGYGREEVLGRNPRLLKSGRQDAEFYDAMWQELKTAGSWSGELWNRRKNGELVAEMVTISAVRDGAGKTRNYVALFADITRMKEHQRELEHIAHYDSLTHLPNRVLLADRLRQAMVQSQRRDQSLAVVYLDLDGFKPINDDYGHEAGDRMLITLAQRMKAALREGDTLARLGGDEFVAVLGDLAAPADCEPVLARLLLAAAEPLTADDVTLRVSASIGVTFYPQDSVDADLLLRHADQAMYQAKQMGKNRYQLFDVAQDAALTTRHENLLRIRQALDRREFVLYYQPKVNMKTGAVIGAEALIRWRHPEQGLLPPGAFLPMIESHPLMLELDAWVIDAALTQMSSWRATGLAIPVSVNVGARQLQQDDFATRLAERLAAHPTIEPAQLELEILETSALEDMAKVSELMHSCLALGVSFALDDFGTGYSSLTYLKRLPAALLKIDQSFVRDMLDDRDDLAIVQGVIGLATAFGRQTIAEGVETVAHGELLLALGCELGQGYAIGRPMPAAELPDWVAGWRPDPSWSTWGAGSADGDDRALVFCEVEHRNWVRQMEAFLAGKQDRPPPLDPHECRFGRWLDAGGRRRYGEHAEFERVSGVHQRVHDVGRELVAVHGQGREADVAARLAELHALHDEMVAAMRRLSRVEANP